MRLRPHRTAPYLFFAAAAAFLAGAAAASAAGSSAPGFWVAGKTYRYALREERSATKATDDKPIVITGLVTISASAGEGGRTSLAWSTSDVTVSPDAGPLRRNIPQLGDSILFDPKLSIEVRLDASGKQAEVANLEAVGAAMRRGFSSAGMTAPNEPFFAKITSKEAIEGAVAKHQLAIARTAPLASMQGTPLVTVVNMPGTALRIGSETYEILSPEAGSSLVHGRWTRVIEKDAANAAAGQLMEQMGAGQVPLMGSDVVERVDVYFDRKTRSLQRAVHAQSVDVDGNPFTMSYQLTRH